MNKKIASGVCAVVLAAACVYIFFLATSGDTLYYTQIDNTKLEQKETNGGVINPEGSMPYSYTLVSYEETGKEKEITFGASRELREGAFLRLTVSSVRGVLSWEEAAYDELPAAVQTHYTAPY